ncbi:phosphate ABC transporter permease PstA [Stratiformator vulcanicus]|nr:ABC transporter permease subunit [Stratiformator vulcanicus]
MAARNEPMLWLCSGALIACLAMILLLLAKIIYEGARTFWPGRIEAITVYMPEDGQPHELLGETVDQSTFILTRDFAKGLPAATQAVAMELLGKEDQARISQTLIRVDNKDVTGSPYRYVREFEIVDGSTSTPEWAVVAERYSWGRLIGIPIAFEARFERQPSADEEQLQQLAAFIDGNVYRLDEQQQATLSEIGESLRDRLAALRVENSKSFLDQYAAKTGAEAELSAVVDGGDPLPLAELPEGSTVDAIIKSTNGSAEAWERFSVLHDSIAERVHEQKRLGKFEIGELSQETEAARQEVLDAERETGQRADAIRGEAVEKIVFLDALEDSMESNDQLASAFTRRFGESRPQAAAAFSKLAKEANDEVEAAAEPVRAELKELLASLTGEARRAVDSYLETEKRLKFPNEEIVQKIESLKQMNEPYALVFEIAGGPGVPETVSAPIAEIIRAYPANQLTTQGRAGVYFSRWGEFLTTEPREANTEGGVLPAIWGTVAMTLVMTIAVVPFGVLAALYLREYAKGGVIVSIIRIAVNNLAGVPSIVFGVFGLGFLIYTIGSFIDGGPKEIGLRPWSGPIWIGVLLAWAVIFAGGVGLWFSVLRASWQSAGWTQRAILCGVIGVWATAVFGGLFVILGHVPFFDGFFRASPSPVFGGGGVLWASLTLALLTLPVVIVATEEALSAVPNTMREGSYACGASKWQTIKKIVLPRALPGILTGTILAVARGAGEVAPLMLVGAVKYAPELPIDTEPPFLHVERRFMHLGYHIFDVGMLSPDVEAAKPMVFTTTLLLITLVALLNVAAIWLRSKLRAKFKGNSF